MRVRVAGPYKPKRSSFWWFRMAVPDRLRAAIGQREIKETLGTTDLAEALVRHARKLADVRTLFASLDQQQASSIDDRADKIVREGLGALARGCGGDKAGHRNAGVVLSVAE